MRHVAQGKTIFKSMFCTDDLRLLGTNSYAMKSEKITETISISKYILWY